MLDLDLGLGLRTTESVRLADINAAETRTKNLEEKARGIAARNWLQTSMDNAQELVLETLEFNRGRYGRLIGYILADGVNLNRVMLEERIVQPYSV